jgi:GNAT superfamily N-acetyltransferase
MPREIYCNDPQWVSPLLSEVKASIDPKKHPFYLHGQAQAILALRDGKPVGRILVSDDPLYNKQHDSNVGMFGMFESIDDKQVSDALLEAAANWLRDRGRSSILGPIDYSTNYPVGLLIDGFDLPHRVLMNHNRPYYRPLLESWGLAKAKDLYAWWFDDPHDMVSKWRKRAERIVERSGVTIRTFRLNDLDAEIERCREVYNSARTDNWGYVKLTEAEFDKLARHLSRVAEPKLVLIAEKEGHPIGFSITLPDCNEALHNLNGRLMNWGLPINLCRFLCRIRRVKTARVMVLDILPEFRRRGISELLILQTLDFGKNVLGYTGAELGWTLEDNKPINRIVERVGARRYKTYRIYEKPI